MEKLNLCLFLSLDQVHLNAPDELAQKYQGVYKNILSFYFKNPDSKLSLFLSGPILSWISKYHPEATTLISKLLKTQIEIVGGGYYNPAFPLIFPADRTGQIEFLTTDLRQEFGKRPRGITLFKSIWDSSLITSFQSCGMEYVFLDSDVASEYKNYYLPLVMSEQGKALKSLLYYDDFVPDANVSPKDFLNNLYETVKSRTENDEFSDKTSAECDERFLAIKLDDKTFSSLFSSGWLENFYATVKNDFSDKIALTLPLEFLRKSPDFYSAYVHSGIKSAKKYTTIQDFLIKNPKNKQLYERMLYIEILLSQCKGDKARKNMAKELLWAAQNGESYFYDDENHFFNSEVRHFAYKYLAEAEKVIRGVGDFDEAVTTFDYDNDGHNEYICAMSSYNACISLASGQITHLDVIHNCSNYAVASRLPEDKYNRGFFVDHLLSDEEFEQYMLTGSVYTGVFSTKKFRQIDFSSAKHEIKLRCDAEYSTMNLPVSLRKNYIANSDGFTVQLILKNESPIALKANLIIESNFAQMNFKNPRLNSYNLEVVSNEEKKFFERPRQCVCLENISGLQITDSTNDISFIYGPNEDCNIIAMPVFSDKGTVFITSLYWKIDLAANREIEKFITFSIAPPKKKRHS